VGVFKDVPPLWGLFLNQKRSIKMEIAKVEMAALEKAVVAKSEIDVVELSELHLALIGGGVGDILLG
jgi:hypothetical protein